METQTSLSPSQHSPAPLEESWVVPKQTGGITYPYITSSEKPPKGGTWRHPNQMSEPPQLTPFDPEKQKLYFEFVCCPVHTASHLYLPPREWWTNMKMACVALMLLQAVSSWALGAEFWPPMCSQSFRDHGSNQFHYIKVVMLTRWELDAFGSKTPLKYKICMIELFLIIMFCGSLQGCFNINLW